MKNSEGISKKESVLQYLFFRYILYRCTIVLKKFNKCKRYVYSNVYFNLFLITDKMQLGPAPVEAVRRGDLGMGYDVDFVYSEVNADVQTFLADPNIDWGFRFGSSNVGPLLLNRVGRD